MPVTMSEEKQSPESGSCISHERPALGRASIASTYSSLARTDGAVLSYHDVEMWGRRHSFIHTARSQPGVLTEAARGGHSHGELQVSLLAGEPCANCLILPSFSLLTCYMGGGSFTRKQWDNAHRELRETHNSCKEGTCLTQNDQNLGYGIEVGMLQVQNQIALGQLYP